MIQIQYPHWTDDIVLHVTRLLKKDDFLIWFKDDKTIKTSDFICI